MASKRGFGCIDASYRLVTARQQSVLRIGKLLFLSNELLADIRRLGARTEGLPVEEALPIYAR